MPLNVDNFKNTLIGGGARPNLFRCILTFPGFAGSPVVEASFLSEAASLPSSNVGVVNMPFRGRQIKLYGDRTFDPWTVTIVNDNNFVVRNAFERWMNGMNEHIENTGFANTTAYETDMFVEQLDREENIVKTYTFRGVFPTNLSEITLNYGDNDNVERFTVTLQYQYWTSDTTS